MNAHGGSVGSGSPQFDLRGARVLVTGGAGFLGTPLCRLLRERGVGKLTILRRRDVDLTDARAVSELMRDARPDVVFHLAAEVGGIGANRASPGRFFYANLAMGLHMIEEARRAGVAKFIQVGTVCSYPKHTPVPFREESLWDGYPEETNAPYGIAKKTLLVMLDAYRRQYGFLGIFLMPTNLYGPGDNFDRRTSHVIPALIRKCEQARRDGAPDIVCWGTGGASREFLYVDDCAEAIVLAAERYDEPEPVNVGAGQEISVRELADIIAEATGFTGDIRWDATKPDGQPRRVLDTSRARKKFGFSSAVTLEDGLRITVDWYRERLASGSPIAVS